MTRRRVPAVVGAGLVAAVAAVALAVPARASTPGDSPVSAPPAGGSSGPVTWSGAIPAGSSNPTSVCPTTGPIDTHTITWTAQADPQTTRSSFTAAISWQPSNPTGSETANDEVLSVANASGTVLASSDGSDPSESVTLVDPASGVYTVIACGYVNTTAQPYAGSVTASSVPVTHAPAPVAESDPGSAPPSSAMPEASLVVGLPLLALVTGGGLVVARRRRAAVR